MSLEEKITNASAENKRTEDRLQSLLDSLLEGTSGGMQFIAQDDTICAHSEIGNSSILILISTLHLTFS